MKKDIGNLDSCDSLLDVIKHMTSKSDECANENMPATAIILEQYAKRLTVIHNRQAVFGDALKRALKTLQKRLDTSDAMTSVLETYVESVNCKPLTFEETKAFEELVDGVDKFEG